MPSRLVVRTLIPLSLLSLLVCTPGDRRQWRPRERLGPTHAEFWERSIRRFERLDSQRPPKPGSVLFVGSSSIRRWSRLTDDMHPLAVLNRGFGGAHIAHVTHFARRVVLPYHPRGVVFYAGDNDIARDHERGPESLVADFRAFVSTLRADGQTAPVYFVSIKPSPRRLQHWPRMRAVNRAVARLAQDDPLLRFIDVATPMFGGDGRPRRELYHRDGLHLSAKGYALWASILRPILLEDLGADAS